MAKALPSITNLGKDLKAELNHTAEQMTPPDQGTSEYQGAPEDEPKAKKLNVGKPNKKGESKGISVKSPTVYLLPQEKSFIKKLEAHILLETGKTTPDHLLIMDAVREYVKNHHPDFKEIKS